MKEGFENLLAAWRFMLLGLTAAVVLAGCAGMGRNTTVAQDSELQDQINGVLVLYDQGKLTDGQAINIIAVLSGHQLERHDEGASVFAEPSMAERPAPAVAMPSAPSTPSAIAQAGNAYQPRTVLSGRLRSVGSDTLDNLMAAWEKDFQRYHPQIRFFHEGKGSSTASPALVESRSDFGPMSRMLKDSERQAFVQRFGYQPLALRIGIDAIAVYVHPSNPIAQRGLSMAELDAIFSAERRKGHPEAITTWGQLGLTGEWANAPVRVYGRNSASGTYGFFQSTVLEGGPYRADVTELPDSEGVVSSVVGDPYGIGYSGVAYKTPGVATSPLSDATGGEIYPPEEQYAYSGEYPLARFVYMTLNHKPGSAPAPLHDEFVRYIFSREGQALVGQEGFFPVSTKIAAEELAKLQ